MYPDTPGCLLYIAKCIPYSLASPIRCGCHGGCLGDAPASLQTRGVSAIHRCLLDAQGCTGYADVSRHPRVYQIHPGVFNTP